MREYLGVIPTAVIGVTLAGVTVREALGYGGCFDFLPLVVMVLAVAVGTVLNLAYLGYVAATRHTYFFDYPSNRQRVAAKCGFVLALALLALESACLATACWSN